MANYINTTTGEYPVFDGNIRRQNPNVSFGDTIPESMLPGLGYAKVESTELPAGDVVTEGKPVLVDGTYFQTWEVREFTPDEKEDNLRSKKAEALAMLQSTTSRSLREGVLFNFGTVEEPDNGYIAMEEGDRVNVIGMKQAAERAISEGSSASMYFRCVDGSIKSISPQKCVDMSWAVYDAFTAVMASSWQLQNSINAASTVADIPAIPESLV